MSQAINSVDEQSIENRQNLTHEISLSIPFKTLDRNPVLFCALMTIQYTMFINSNRSHNLLDDFVRFPIS